MWKKFGKFLLVITAVASAAATVYYCLRKKDTCPSATEEDPDSFSFDQEEEEVSRTYVPLNREEADNNSLFEETTPTKDMATEEILEAAEEIPEATEEFFNEEDL